MLERHPFCLYTHRDDVEAGRSQRSVTLFMEDYRIHVNFDPIVLLSGEQSAHFKVWRWYCS
jgi:hypothetical protein